MIRETVGTGKGLLGFTDSEDNIAWFSAKIRKRIRNFQLVWFAQVILEEPLDADVNHRFLPILYWDAGAATRRRSNTRSFALAVQIVCEFSSHPIKNSSPVTLNPTTLEWHPDHYHPNVACARFLIFRACKSIQANAGNTMARLKKSIETHQDENFSSLADLTHRSVCTKFP